MTSLLPRWARGEVSPCNGFERPLRQVLLLRADYSPAETPLFAVPENGGAQASAPSAPSAPRPKSSSVNGFAAPDLRPVANDADGPPNGAVETVRANPLKSKDGTVTDGADANPPPQSGPEKTGAPGWSTRL